MKNYLLFAHLVMSFFKDLIDSQAVRRYGVFCHIVIFAIANPVILFYNIFKDK